MFRSYRFLFVVLTSILIQQTSMSMSYLRRTPKTRSARTASTTASQSQRTYLRGISSTRKTGEPDSATVQEFQMPSATAQAKPTVQPKRTWGQWFTGLFRRTPTDEQINMAIRDLKKGWAELDKPTIKQTEKEKLLDHLKEQKLLTAPQKPLLLPAPNISEERALSIKREEL